MRSFNPRTAIVTGGAAGIGLALAQQLVDGGCFVVIADKDAVTAEGAAQQLNSGREGCADARVLDVTDRAAIDALVHEVAADHDGLDLMVNNAGALFAGPFDETTAAHWDLAIALNLRAVVDGTHAAYEVMKAQPVRGGRRGTILNTGSLAGLMPGPRMTPYTTTKWAVVGFSQALRAEAAAHRISVSVLCPGYVDTKLLDEVTMPTAGYRPGSFRANTRLLQGRLLTPALVAQKAMDGLESGRAVIPVGAFAQFVWRAQRFAPATVSLGTRIQAAREHRQARTGVEEG